jgi:hypothetical protein
MRYLMLLLVIVLVSCGHDELFCEPIIPEQGLTQAQLESGIVISFSEEAFDSVKMQRSRAKDINYHFKEKGDFVPAIFSCQGLFLKIKARLKGGEIDHLDGEFWSFKLKSKRNLGFGHNKLAIQSPHTKNFLLEYLFHKVCKQQGIIGLEYFFVPVIINDSLKHNYAMATVVNAHTSVLCGRGLGPVLKFDKREYWKHMVEGEKQIDSLFMLKAPIKSCDAKWTKKNKEQHRKAATQLADYRSGKLQPSDVFEYDLYARYVAISELLGSSHNLRWLNLRFYYHPETKKIEPIAFDCYDGVSPRNEGVWFKEDKRFEYFLHPLLDDPVFRTKVESYLKIYCSPEFVKNIFLRNHSDLTKYQKLIREDEPAYLLSRNHMLKRAKYILSTLE